MPNDFFEDLERELADRKKLAPPQRVEILERHLYLLEKSVQGLFRMWAKKMLQAEDRLERLERRDNAIPRR